MNNEFTFTFTEQEANIILQALAELPFRTSAGVIAKLREQAAQQMQNAAPQARAEESVEG